MKLIYLAGPYRAATERQKTKNIEAAIDMGIELCRHGLYPVIPHANTRDFDLYTDQTPEFFLEGTMEQMRRCDAVLFSGDWQVSEGCLAEFVEAERMAIPHFLSLKELLERYPIEYRTM